MEIIKVIVLSFIEGLTEFIPVSSTGHMIIVEHFITLSNNKNFVNSFEVIIQLGAILSVIIYFYNDIQKLSKEYYTNLIIAVLPAAILGLLFDDYINDKLFNVYVVSFMLILYGIILIFIENIIRKKDEKLTKRKAFFIGMFQSLAMIPGTSRSAITIIGAMLLGINKIEATKFSFFLAIPTMLGATTLKIIKMPILTKNEYFLIALGFTLSFVFAYIFISFFLNYIKKHSFKVFGYYRIVIGILVLLFR